MIEEVTAGSPTTEPVTAPAAGEQGGEPTAEPEKKFTQADLNSAEKRWKGRARKLGENMKAAGFVQDPQSGEWSPPSKAAEPTKDPKAGEDDYKRGFADADAAWKTKFASVDLDRGIERELTKRGLHPDLAVNVRALADIQSPDDIESEVGALIDNHPLFSTNGKVRPSTVATTAPTSGAGVLTPGRQWTTTQIADTKRSFGGTAPKEYQDEWTKARKEGRIKIVKG